MNIYLIVCEVISPGGYEDGGRSIIAFTDKEKAIEDMRWYRQEYLVPELQIMTKADREKNELDGDLIDEPDHIYLVDTVRIRIETATLIGNIT
jgi:hypothetical protein